MREVCLSKVAVLVRHLSSTWPCLVERFLGKNVKSVPSTGKKCPEIRSQTRGLPSEIE